MIVRNNPKYFLYLKDSRLVGIGRRGESVLKVLDTPIDNISVNDDIAGEAVLLLNSGALEHQIIALPAQGKFSIPRTMTHELESITRQSADQFVYDWRPVGNGIEEDAEQTFYLLAWLQRADIIPLVNHLAQSGLRIVKIISTLDLLIHLGRARSSQGGSGLMVFDDPMVRFLFFRDGSYGFERSFELREEGFHKDFMLEIQRSFYYTKQKFKTPIDRVSILLAPEWVQRDLADELQETLGVPIEFVSPARSECRFPDLDVFNLLLVDEQVPLRLINLLPKEYIRERETRRIARSLVFTEVIVIILALLWAYNAVEFQKQDLSLYALRYQHLQTLESRVERHQPRIERQQTLAAELKAIDEHLQSKKHFHLYLAAIPYLLPDTVTISTLTWGSDPLDASGGERKTETEPHGIIKLTGAVNADAARVRYDHFFQFIGNLENAPFVKKVTYNGDVLLTAGTFELYVQVKRFYRETSYG